MKTAKRRVKAKGDRLNWTPLKDVKSVQLSNLNVKGQIVVLAKKANVPVAKILVP